MKLLSKLFATLTLLIVTFVGFSQTYPIVDTDVSDHYDNSAIISAPTSGQAFYGQDATYNGNQPSYTDNGDGTITDNVTGLMWEQDMGVKISYYDAIAKAANSTLGGHTDWRVPTIKELYSLAQFSGRCMGDDAMYKFIDTNYFVQPIGNTAIGEREIDGQTWSITKYVGLTMFGDSTVFGYNFVDGRLKGYPMYEPPTFTVAKTMYFRMVRGNTQYGINNFVDNGDGTITDNATGLMWQQADDGTTRDWENALSYSESLTLGGHNDWRLPNAKELHSILDYTRSPDVSGSPAIDPIFSCTSFNDPSGAPGQYGYYWTSSPLMDGPSPYTDAVYICFGEAQGEMESPPGSGNFTLVDTHGAGAQRNDTKTGNPANYPQYFGPQGDVVYVFNYTRAVRDVGSTSIDEETKINFNVYPNPATNQIIINSTEQIKTISIYNAVGKKVMEERSNQKRTIVNTAQLTNGVYIIKVIAEDGNVANERFTILK
jgi:hypothetical protein